MKAAETRALWQRLRFEWGRHDCILAVCAHVAAVTGRDPAAPWRGSYSDEAGALAVMAPFGGVLGIMRHGMALAGFPEGAAADGAPVVARIGGQEVAGVMMGRFVGLVAPRGLVECRAPVLAAWVI